MPNAPFQMSDLRRRIEQMNEGPIAWLFVVFLLLHGVSAGVQQLMWLLGLISVVALLRDPKRWMSVPGTRDYWLLMACLLLPAVISAVDSVSPDRSLSTILRLVLYGMAGRWLLRLAPTPDQWSLTVLAMLAVLTFWVLDGLVQEITGFNVIGIPPMSDSRFGHRIGGLIGRDYGATLAILSPLAFEAIRLHSRRWPLLWLCLPLLASAITLSASRNSMVLLLVSGALYTAWVVPFADLKRRLLLIAVGVLFLLAAMLLPALALPHLAARLEAGLSAMTLDWTTFSTALSFRPSLWVAAWQLFLDNPVNGVGVRSSGQAMLPILEQSPLLPQFAGAVQEDWFPHWVLMEVLSDMGLIGLAAYGLFISWLLSLARNTSPQVRTLILIALLSFFPFSTTLALFSYQATLLGLPALAFAMAARSNRGVIDLGPWGASRKKIGAGDINALSNKPEGPRVLIVRLSAIGDVVFASPLIGAVRRRLPDARISWLVEPVAAPLLCDNSELHEVIVWDKERWQSLWTDGKYLELFRQAMTFRRTLRRQQFDLVLDVQGLLKSAVLASWTGAQHRIGFASSEPTGLFLTQRFDKRVDTNRIGSEYLGIAEDVGLSPGAFRMDIALSDSNIRLADQERDEGAYAVICPFTTRPQKHWVDSHWFELAELIDRTYGLRVIVLGGPSDREHSARLVDGSIIKSRVGTQSLAASAALVSRASLLVGVDTGMTHMGIAFGVPTVALFGSTCPYRDTTRSNAAVIYHDLPCAPCRRNPTCNGKFQCLTEITPQEVMAVASRLPGMR